jgi:hypothetical protein
VRKTGGFNRRAALALIASHSLIAKGKRTLHPRGFSFELPDRWKWEPAEQGGVLLPPGVSVDPEKEDNPEVYAIRIPAEDGPNAERRYIEELKADLRTSKITADRGGDLENFPAPGIGGVIYTFDFTHPRQKVAFRIRVFAMSSKGRTILLTANGHRLKVESRDRLLREVARSFAWR